MIICKYKRLSLKHNKYFVDVITKEFKTTTKEEAKKIIKEWNRRGQLQNEMYINYKYNILETKPILNEFKEDKIPFFQRRSC